MVTVPPLAPPTPPPLETVPTVAGKLLQVPPLTVLFRVTILPWQTVNVPVMAAGLAFTVIASVWVVVPQPFVLE